MSPLTATALWLLTLAAVLAVYMTWLHQPFLY